jgi:hypothetical protein
VGESDSAGEIGGRRLDGERGGRGRGRRRPCARFMVDRIDSFGGDGRDNKPELSRRIDARGRGRRTGTTRWRGGRESTRGAVVGGWAVGRRAGS